MPGAGATVATEVGGEERSGDPIAVFVVLDHTPVPQSFAALRLRTDAAKRFKKVANATAVVWKVLLVAERKFRRINSPELLRLVG